MSILTSLFSCTGKSQVESKSYSLLLKTLLSHTVQEISAEELHQLKDSVILIDAREPAEYKVSHIKDAIAVGYDNADTTLLDQLPKDKKIVVYCSVGYRSEKIAERLQSKGFKDVSNLYGGIFEWKNVGYEVVNDSGKTENVHAFNKKWGIWLNKGNKVYE